MSQVYYAGMYKKLDAALLQWLSQVRSMGIPVLNSYEQVYNTDKSVTIL